MKGRVRANGGGPPTDLLVCFPTRSHLTLMPKPICSPSRPTDHPKRQHPRQSRPLFRTGRSARSQIDSEIVSEPTSPKVTCAGQIKVRPKNRTGRPRSDSIISKNWLESVGLKKDVMHFLGALRSLRFNMHCFGSFPRPVLDSSSDEEEEEEEEEEVISSGSRRHSSTIFSKWLMVLEEGQQGMTLGDDNESEKEEEEEEEKEEMPPKNALLLMRCRSAPAKRGEEVAKKLTEEEKRGNEDEDDERLMSMSYAPDFFKVSTDIAKETWVVGSVDPLGRSRSWRR